jgi:hypothetical protein
VNDEGKKFCNIYRCLSNVIKLFFFVSDGSDKLNGVFLSLTSFSVQCLCLRVKPESYHRMGYRQHSQIKDLRETNALAYLKLVYALA